VAAVVPAMLAPMAASVALRIGQPAAGVDGLVMTGTLALALVTFPILIVARRLRPLLRLGYTTDDIAAGLRTTFERRREEFLFEYGPRRSVREIAFRVVSVGGVVTAGVAVVAMLTGGSNPALPAVAGFGAYFGLLAGALSRRWRALRTGSGSFWAQRWQGLMGRVLTRLASIKLGPRALLTDRPTEVAIALSAQAVYDELPRDTRRAIGDVPGVLKELEAQARAMRARVDVLATTALEAQEGSARPDARARQDALLSELRRARDAAEQRLAELVTALETLRLDLLRLRAGQGSAESITQSLHAARQLGDDVDRLIAGAAEVDRALQRGDPVTPA